MGSEAGVARPGPSGVVRALLSDARPSPRVLAAILLLTLANALLALALPWPLQFLIDYVLGSRPIPPGAAATVFRLLHADRGTDYRSGAVIALAAVGFVLYVLNGLIGALRTRVEVSAGQRSVYELRARLFEHLERLTLRTHQALPLGDQLYRLSDDTYCIDQLVFSGFLPLLGAALTLVSMFFVLFHLDPLLAMCALAVIPPLVACVHYYLGPLETASTQVRERESEVVTFAERVLAALPVVKVFARERDEAVRFREQGTRVLADRLKLTARETGFGLVVGGITAAGTALVLTVGGLHVLRGTLSPGQLLVALAYLTQVYDPLHTISHTLGQMQTAAAGARRVLEVLETEGEAAESTVGDSASMQLTVLPPLLTGRIVFESVRFGYRTSASPVLSDVSFEVAPGSVVAIVGPTGAGKTTLISLLLRFYDPDGGRVLIDEIDVRGVAVGALRRQISVVLQEPLLFPISIAENIRYGRPDASDADVCAAARAAHADEFIQTLPDGYASLVAEGGVSLSGGERQRIALARAFLKDAPILVLDEPTSSLDAATESLILESMERLCAGRTTLIIAHRLSTIRRADQILFLQDGCITERGTHRSLLAEAGDYARLHDIYLRASIGNDNQ